MTPRVDQPVAGRRLRRRPLGTFFIGLMWLAGMIMTAYLAFGYWLLPHLIQSQGVALVNQYLAGRLAVHHVAVDPFGFELQLQGLEVRDEYGDLVASATDLVVDLVPRALWAREIRFERIHLIGPWLNVIREEGGGINLARLFDAEVLGAPASDVPATASYRLKVDELAVINGTAMLTDNRDLTPAIVNLLPISFTLRDLTTASAGLGSNVLRIGFADGGTLSWQGSVGLRPLRAEGQLRISNLSTVLPWRFLRDELAIAEPRGRLELAARYRFDWQNAQPALTVSDLEANLSGLALQRQGAPQPFLQIARASLRDGQYRLAGHVFSAAELRVAGASVNALWRDGQFDWQTLIVRDPARTRYAPNSQPIQPFLLSIERIDLSDVGLTLEDQDRPQPLRFAVDGLDGACRFQAQRTADREEMRIHGLQLSATGVGLRQQDASEALLTLNRVHLNQGEIDLLEPRIELPEVTLQGGRALLELRAPGGSNWRAAEPSLGVINGARTANIDIGQVRIVDAQFAFKDARRQPAFASKLHALNGSISGLSTRAIGTAEVALSGQIGDSGTLAIQGRVDPLDLTRGSVLAMNYQNIDMASLTPYSTELTGYEIKAGKLSIDLTQQLDGQQLTGDHRILVEGLVLGDQVDSPAAFELPLALALLQDAKARIRIDVPVSGALSDPQFSYPQRVWEGVRRQLVRAARSPFRALGAPPGLALDGRSEVSFAIGARELAPSERAKLATIAGLLRKRSGLQLLIRPVFARQEDASALQAQALNRALAERLEISLAPGEETQAFDFGDPTIRDGLEGLFVRRLGPQAWVDANRQIPLDESPQARYTKLHAQLAAREALAKNALKQLAIKRAQAIADALTGAAGIAASRLRSEAPVEAAALAAGDRSFVVVELSLVAAD